MPRIPDAELDRLKRDLSVQRLIEARGVVLKPHGKDLIGLCPMHADTNPSLVVSPAKNLWHCLGACQTGGSVIDWVMKAEGLDFRSAVERLRSNGFSSSTPKPETEAPPCHLDPDADDAELLGQVADFYHATLKASPEAMAYLEKRGIASPEAIDRFRLGYANRTLCYRLPTKKRRDGREIRARLQALGVLRDTGHEHANGCLVIPIPSASGGVAQLYGRKIGEHLPAECPRHLVLPRPLQGIWNEQAIEPGAELILCEGLIDALTFWCAGYPHVTATLGAGGLSRELEDAIASRGVGRVLIAYDRDEAGERGAETVAARLLARGIACARVLFPRNLDANAYALRVKPANGALGLLLMRAVPLGNGGQGLGPSAPEPEAAPEPDPVPRALSPAPASEGAPSVASPAPAGGTDERAAREEALESGPEAAPSLAAEACAQEPPSRARREAPADRKGADRKGADRKGGEVELSFGDRRYRVRGLGRNLSFEQLKVNLLVARDGAFHVDHLDLYSARHRATFVKDAAAELGVEEETLKRDVGKVLGRLEELQERMVEEALAPKEEAPRLSEAEQAEAMALLRDPRLLGRVLADFERCGVVGEETNKLVGYLAAVSRKLEEPLSVIIQSCSAAGKTSLQEAIFSFVPEEDRVQYSALTGQSLFYLEGRDLRHRVLGVVEEEGAEKATYALKLLQSEGELTIASTGKDPETGRHVTQEYRVEGPVAIFLATTAVEVEEELLNRCLVLTVDEEREQTRAIHKKQRERRTLVGLLGRCEREEVLRVHRNAQRLLRPLAVANPYAPHLTFLDSRTRTRRDHEKYLSLIETIALLHQHQRPVKRVVHQGREVEYVEVTLEDIEVANRLAHEVLGRSLDELAPQTRRLLELLDAMVKEACGRLELERAEHRFTQREVRESTGWTAYQVKVHLRKLEEMEYAIAHRSPRGQGFVYELLYQGEGESGRPFLLGLTEVAELRRRFAEAEGQCDARAREYVGKRVHGKGDREHEKRDREGAGRCQVGAR